MGNERFIRPKYPHMGPEESAIWTDFLRKTDLEFVDIRYDVRVGPPNVPPHMMDLAKATGLDELTRIRIDAVGETKDEIWIFEVKHKIGRSALGQLLEYGDWYVHDFSPTKHVRLAAVGRVTDPSTEESFRRRGMFIFLV
jgi:hypothetical protein